MSVSVSAQWAPSLISNSLATIVVAGVPQTLDVVWIVEGKTPGGAPATFADMTNTTTSAALFFTQVQWNKGAGRGTVQVSDIGGMASAGTLAVGDEMWVAVFIQSAQPATTDAPVATAGPFLVQP